LHPCTFFLLLNQCTAVNSRARRGHAHRPCSQGESRGLIGQSGLFATSRCGIVTKPGDMRGTGISTCEHPARRYRAHAPDGSLRANRGRRGWEMWNFGRASDDEALKLVVAYLNISEPERRKQVLALAEELQRASVPLAKKEQPSIWQDNRPNENAAAGDPRLPWLRRD
jgi:hypothetical protein